MDIESEILDDFLELCRGDAFSPRQRDDFLAVLRTPFEEFLEALVGMLRTDHENIKRNILNGGHAYDIVWDCLVHRPQGLDHFLPDLEAVHALAAWLVLLDHLIDLQHDEDPAIGSHELANAPEELEMAEVKKVENAEGDCCFHKAGCFEGLTHFQFV